MAGRNHLPPEAIKLREVHLAAARMPHPALIDDHRFIHRVQGPGPPLSPPAWTHPALIEERIAAQHREIQTLIFDNQRLAATHVALKQELAAAQQELRHLSTTTASVKAERESEVHEVYEKSMKMEAEVCSIDGLNAKLAQVRADVQKLSAQRRELKEKLRTINADLARAHSESQHLHAIKAEMESMHQEIQRGRAAVEYEKKTHANNLEQSEAMEKNMISMAREIEKLRAELANAEKRARAAAAAAAVATPSCGTSEIGYGGSSYPNPYVVHQVQGGADAGRQYGPYVHG